jgi:hypothetical protein
MLMLFPDLGQMIGNLGMLMYWLIAIVLMRFFWVEARTETPVGVVANE